MFIKISLTIITEKLNTSRTKLGWNSVYDKDILKNISEEEYKKRQKLNLGLCK